MINQIINLVMQTSLVLGISILVYTLVTMSAELRFNKNSAQELLNKIKLNQETQMIAYLLIIISTIGIILTKII